MTKIPFEYKELEAVYGSTLGRGYNVVAVASAEPGEGVSTLAYALAQRCEAAGRNTLLIDLNLFHPSLDARFGVARQDWIEPDGSLRIEAGQAPGSNLTLLAAPNNGVGAIRLREKTVLEQKIAVWREQFDAIIIDTSAINAVNRGNIPAETVCANCDGTIMVVLAGQTTQTSLRLAYSRLSSAGAKLLGTVINDRSNPSLGTELIRETLRFNSLLPTVMGKMRDYFRNSAFLNPKC